MDKKLPKLFQNKIDEKAGNNENIFYSQKNCYPDGDYTEMDIRKKINDIFSSVSYIYSAKVDIYLDNTVKTTKIIGHNKDYLITIDNEKIYISDIKDIKLSN